METMFQQEGKSITIPMLSEEGCTLYMQDPETGQNVLTLDVMMTELIVEDMVIEYTESGKKDHGWIEEFAKWLSEKAGITVSPSNAWHIHQAIDHHYKIIKKKSNQSLTLPSSTESIHSEEPSPQAKSDSLAVNSQDSEPSKNCETEPVSQS